MKHVDLLSIHRTRATESYRLCIEGFAQHSRVGSDSEQELNACRDAGLRLVLRLLFVMFADDRGLLVTPPGSARGETAFSTVRKEIARRVAGSGSADPPRSKESDTLWGQLTQRFTQIAELRGESAASNPQGLLFAAGSRDRFLGESRFARAIDLLSRVPNHASGPGRLKYLDYGDIPVQQMGSIYEILLELQPRLVACEDGEASVVFDKTATDRRNAGSYYTPDPVVRYIVAAALQPYCQQIASTIEHRPLPGDKPQTGSDTSDGNPRRAFAERIFGLKLLDPAVGAGHFLVRAGEMLAASIADFSPRITDCKCRAESVRNWKREVIGRCLYGVDVDPLAVDLAKLSLWIEADDPELAMTFLDSRLRCGDSLVDEPLSKPKLIPAEGEAALPARSTSDQESSFSWQAAFPEVFDASKLAAGFDAVLSNPPYLNIRLLGQQRGTAIKEYLRRRYDCAHGGFDIYVLFLEKAYHLLKQGGRYGVIVPNKIGSLDYAARCRELLLTKTSFDVIADVSGLDLFAGIGVYPYILVGAKSAPSKDHCFSVLAPMTLAALGNSANSSSLRQSTMSAENGLTLHGALNVESRVETKPLHEVACLYSGTTGFTAQRMANALCEGEWRGAAEFFTFVVSGNIDRYSVERGPVRFAKRIFRAPVLPVSHEVLSEQKRKLFLGSKLVVSGMSRRLEVALDPGGLALGVQVYAVNEFLIDARYLLGVLNSKLMSHIFSLRFQAKRLAGGYLSINKGQLARLPIRVANPDCGDDMAAHDRIVELVRRLNSSPPLERAAGSSESVGQRKKELDVQIDRAVYELYRVTEEEIEQIERSVAEWRWPD